MNQTIPPPSRSGWSKNRVHPIIKRWTTGLATAGALLVQSQFVSAQTFFDLSSSNYSQDFASISGWSNNYAAGTGASNWRTATSVATSTLNTTTVFSTGTAGGVQKGTQTIIFLAAGTNTAATDLLMNFADRQDGVLSFDYAKVANSASATPRSSDLKIQFSLDNGATFSDVTGYTIPRIFNSSTAESGSLTVTLPPDIDDEAQVVLRFFFWNNGEGGGSGNRPKWSVDNIVVSSSALALPPAVPNTPTASAITSSSFTANWDAVVDALSYKLDVATDSGFTSFVSGYQNLTVTGTSQIVSGLNGSTTYYARVRSVGAGDATSASSATLTVTTSVPVDPFVGVSKTTLTALTTTYGTPSAADTFLVNGSLLAGDITITAPSGLEVSQTSSSSGFSATQVLDGSSGTVSSASIWVRLKADATVSGSFNGLNVTLASSGVTTVNVATAASGNAVSPKNISVTGLTAAGKNYDANNSVTVTGTPSYTGLENGESFAVTGSPTWAFETKTAGIGKSVIATGSFDAPSSNYTVTNPVLSADIAPLAITVTGASVVTRPYDGTTAAQITGATPVGVLMGDTVTVAGGGTFASAAIGTGISVTANLTLGGTDGGNYTLTQPTGLTGEITLGVQTITFAALPNKFSTDAPFELTATASSGLPVSYMSSNPLVATVSGSTLTIVGAGTTLISASQAGDANYGPATDVSQTQIVLPPPSVLAPGDIAVIALQADTPDTFAFLALVDINPGTLISFTDNAWTNADPPALNSNEGTIVWQAPVAGVARGTVVTWIAGTGFSTGTVASTAGSLALATGGDQILAYQGTSTSPTFIYGLSSSLWRTSGSVTNGTSYIPAGLVNGISARDNATSVDNFYFNPLTNSGTQEELLALIGNIANWTATNTPLTSLPSWTFNVTTGSTPDPLFTDPTLNAVLSDQPAGVKRLSFTGIPGRVYGIQRSDDLSDWTQIDTVTTPPGGAVTFDDPSPLPGKGFYRIIFPAEPPP